MSTETVFTEVRMELFRYTSRFNDRWADGCRWILYMVDARLLQALACGDNGDPPELRSSSLILAGQEVELPNTRRPQGI